MQDVLGGEMGQAEDSIGYVCCFPRQRTLWEICEWERRRQKLELCGKLMNGLKGRMVQAVGRRIRIVYHGNFLFTGRMKLD